ncbi:MAG TPA: GAF domain-containing sensor histidine kinase [Ktedonobacterales bacterium]|nr:GAF domain-containing sensor histidine kinase [Ktedonobacterales bacterium]
MTVTQDGVGSATNLPEPNGPHSETERLRRRNRQLEEQIQALTLVLQGVANTLSAEIDLRPLLRRIVLVGMRLTGASVGAAYVLDTANDTLVAQALENAETAAGSNIFSPLASFDPAQSWLYGPEDENTNDLRPRVAAHEGVVGHVAQSGELTLIVNPEDDPRFSPEQIASDVGVLGMQVGSMMTTPMIFKGAITGALQLAKAPGAGVFDAWSLDLMRTLAAQGAVAVANAQMYRRVRNERDRIMQTQEDERKRLGRELHDGPAQKLAQIVMSLEFAGQLIGASEPDRAIEEIGQARDTATDATHEIRNLLFDLRPLVLDAENGGLIAALRHFTERFRKGPGPTIKLAADYPERLSHNVELTTFAIVQEAVNNALKHAEAQHVWIDVRETDDNLVATVRDDGKGFDPDQVREEYETRGSWGMLSMSERATLIEATISIASRPGKGAIVTLTAPRIPREQREQ